MDAARLGALAAFAGAGMDQVAINAASPPARSDQDARAASWCPPMRRRAERNPAPACAIVSRMFTRSRMWIAPACQARNKQRVANIETRRSAVANSRRLGVGSRKAVSRNTRVAPDAVNAAGLGVEMSAVALRPGRTIRKLPSFSPQKCIHFLQVSFMHSFNGCTMMPRSVRCCRGLYSDEGCVPAVRFSRAGSNGAVAAERRSAMVEPCLP